MQGEYRPITISLMAAMALVSYNNLSVTAALPNIGDSLGSVGLLPWIITIELLTSAVAVLAIGPLVDSFGVQQVFRISLTGFVVASVACAFAPSMVVLIIFRAVQGVTAGGVMGATIACIGLAYVASVRPAVFAANSAIWGIMGVAGPAIAAGLVTLFDWRSIFLIAIPIGGVAAAIGWNRLPGQRPDTEQRDFDRTGLGLVAVVATALLAAASTRSVWAVAGLAVAVGVGAMYVAHSKRIDAPVVHLHHLTGRRWRNVHITSSFAVACTSGASAFLPVYLKGSGLATQSQAAFSVLFMVTGWSIAAWTSSRMQRRMHAATVVRIGSTMLIASMIAATLLVLFRLPVPLLLGCFVLVGGGVGTVSTAGLSLMQGRARASEMGRVSSAHQFLRSLGFAYGAAIAGLVLFVVVERRIDDLEIVRKLLGDGEVVVSPDTFDALHQGYLTSLAVTTGFALITSVSARRLVRAIGTELDEPENAHSS